MRTKNLIVACLLALGGLSALPTAQADLVEVSGPACDVESCIENACAKQGINCDVECTWTTTDGVSSCVPVCPVYHSADWACPQPINPCTVWDQSISGLACPVCPWPPGSLRMCPILPPINCSIQSLCGVCDYIAIQPDPCNPPPPCDLSDPECYEIPDGWHCSANGEDPDGLIPATLDYASDMGSISCGLAGGLGMTSVEQAEDSAYYGGSQADATLDYAASWLNVRGRFDDHGLVADARGEAADQGNLACGFLLGDSTGCVAGSGPAPAACPAQLPSGGGVVGDTLAYADAACGSAAGAQDALVDDARAIAIDTVATVRAVGDSVDGFVGERTADASDFLGETQDNAANAQAVVESTATATVVRTCTYLVGSSTCA